MEYDPVIIFALMIRAALVYCIYCMADTRGRNVWSWTIISALTQPLLAIILLAVMGDKKKAAI